VDNDSVRFFFVGNFGRRPVTAPMLALVELTMFIRKEKRNKSHRKCKYMHTYRYRTTREREREKQQQVKEKKRKDLY